MAIVSEKFQDLRGEVLLDWMNEAQNYIHF
jgi:hypothetical protein